jgi:hypothetical protein
MENGVHQGSPISPASLNVYMEHVIGRVIDRYVFTFWHKLYADELGLNTNHKYLIAFLTTLHDVSCKYDFRIIIQRYLQYLQLKTTA